MESHNYVITIGRQPGAGGAQLGRILARNFGFNYVDREILVKAAYDMDVPAKSLEGLEERERSIWQKFNRADVSEMHHMPRIWQMPTEILLFEAQTTQLEQAAREASCVIVGRSASYIFEKHPRMISIFLHADTETRLQRLAEVGKIEKTGTDAEKELMKRDRDRGRYFKTYTGKDWLDARAYELCINTGKTDIQTVSEIVSEYICRRFPELRKEYHKRGAQ